MTYLIHAPTLSITSKQRFIMLLSPNYYTLITCFDVYIKPTTILHGQRVLKQQNMKETV